MKTIVKLFTLLLILNSCEMKKESNPLLQNFDTPYQTPPFSKIKTEHFIPALKKTVEKTKNNIEEIISNKEKPNFKNTIEALEYSNDRLGVVSSIFYNLSSAQNTEELQKISEEFSTILTEYSNYVSLNSDLFKKIKEVYDNEEIKNNLNSEELVLLEETYKSFSRNGADLPKEKKDKLETINKELSKLYVNYGQNVLKATSSTFVEAKENEVEGISKGYLNSAKKLAKDKKKEGYLFDITSPTATEVLKNGKNRELRKKMYMAVRSKAYKGEYDNQGNVLKIVENRIKLSNLLGAKSYSDFVLQDRMAKDKMEVMKFLEDLAKDAMPYAKKEIKKLEDFAKKTDNIDKLQSWDYSYYLNKLQEVELSFNDDLIKPYFKLENCVNGMFDVANKMFGITFEEVKNIDIYHPEVKTYEVKENGNVIAIFYTDYFPRKEKRGGAWMTSFRGQSKKNNKNEIPQISIVCNFTKPTGDTPSLLTFNEYTTLFHEFGHALHGMLSDVKYESLSGTSVYKDFVELPSQIMENWCSEKEVLNIIAKHYKTGEVIPQKYIDKIKELDQFFSGIASTRQISFGYLDMSWHNLENMEGVNNVAEFENKAMKEFNLFPYVEGTNMSCFFSHLFDGAGYATGYYSYKWAEVLEADAFELFKEKGIFNKEVSKDFREYVLSKGGTEHPLSLYIKFRKKEPSVKALSKKLGFRK